VRGWLRGDFPASAELIRPCSATADSWHRLDRSTGALVVYTSGSTGLPVAIEKRLSQLFDEVVALEAAFGTRLGDAFVLGTVSHQHIYGLLHRVLWPLAAGRPIVAERHAFPESVVAAVMASNPAVLVSSPAPFKRLPADLEWDDVRPRLRAVFSSGGPLPARALPACRALLGQARSRSMEALRPAASHGGRGLTAMRRLGRRCRVWRCGSKKAPSQSARLTRAESGKPSPTVFARAQADSSCSDAVIE